MSINSKEANTEYVYKAFISYRHKPLDKSVAKKIHFALEHYLIPKELRDKNTGNRLGKVFRDEEELPATGNLSESISYALEHSEYLIVICTPDTPESKWVREEISRFKKMHGHDHIIAVLARGTPDESFPEELTLCMDPDHPGQTKKIEPLAPNLTDMNSSFDRKRFKREAVRIYAAILGCPYDTLWQRERRYAMRKTLLLVSAVSAVILAFAVSVLIYNRKISERNREISEKNRMIEQQNAEITSRNKEIEEANSELKLKESAALIREAELLTDNGDNDKAIASVLNAVSSEEGTKEYGDKAEYLLTKALGAGQFSNEMRRYSSVSLDNNVTEIKISELKDRFYSVDTSGTVRCFSYPDLDQKWAGSVIDMSRDKTRFVKSSHLVEIPDENILLYCGGKAVTALSCDDGSTVWKNDNLSLGFAGGFAVSEDRKTLGILAFVPGGSDAFGAQTCEIQQIDVKTGKVIKSLHLPREFDEKYVFVSGNNMAFSKSGRFLALTVYFQLEGTVLTYDKCHLCTLIADLDEDHIIVARNENIETTFFEDYPTVIGTHFSDDEKSVYIMDYDIDDKSVRFTRSLLSGGSRELFSYPQNMFDKYVTSAVDYIPLDMNKGRMLAFCDNVAYFGKADPQNENYGMREYEDMILHYGYINDDQSARLLITNNARQHAEYLGSNWGTFAGPFLDMMHLTDLDITDGFARDLTEGSGYTMDPDAWGIAISEDDPKKIYLILPNIDPHIEKIRMEDRIDEYYLHAAMPDETHVAIYGKDRETGGFVIYVYDLSEQKIIKNYYIETVETDSFLVYDTAGEKEHIIKDLCPGSSERIICPGDKTPAFAVSDKDGHIRVYDSEKEIILQDIDLSSTQEEILSLKFCKDDKELAVWTSNAHLQLFDISTREIMYDEYTKVGNSRESDSNPVYMTVTEDPDNERLYFLFTSGQSIVIDSESYIETAFIPCIDLYCQGANEIWIINGGNNLKCGEISGVFKHPAYTYNELIEWAKEG